jgi:hypothetical protein
MYTSTVSFDIIKYSMYIYIYIPSIFILIFLFWILIDLNIFSKYYPHKYWSGCSPNTIHSKTYSKYLFWIFN